MSCTNSHMLDFMQLCVLEQNICCRLIIKKLCFITLKIYILYPIYLFFIYYLFIAFNAALLLLCSSHLQESNLGVYAYGCWQSPPAATPVISTCLLGIYTLVQQQAHPHCVAQQACLCFLLTCLPLPCTCHRLQERGSSFDNIEPLSACHDDAVSSNPCDTTVSLCISVSDGEQG